jgi:hypothetical protein
MYRASHVLSGSRQCRRISAKQRLKGEEDKITGQVRQTLQVFVLSCNSDEVRDVGVII